MPFFKDIAKRLRIRMHRHILDRGYDAGRHIETAGVLSLGQLDLTGENAPRAVQYEPTPITLFVRVLRRLARKFDLSQFVFVDIGSGKGRTLFLAAEWPFHRIEDVELSARLHEIASNNIQHITANGDQHPRVVLLNQDATTYQFPSEPLVVYLFNPFDAPVLEQARVNLRRSLDENPRDCIVIYLNAKHRGVFDRDPSFAELPRTPSERMREAIFSPWPITIYRGIESQ